MMHSSTMLETLNDASTNKLVRKYRNPACRDLQRQFVYTKCYEENEMGRELVCNPSFRTELEFLKTEYMRDLADPIQCKGAASTRPYALLHGDLHAGSVMYNHRSA